MCVFCEIASGMQKAEVVYEDAVCMAFLDSDPIAEGHLLLIPKGHFIDADDMPEETFVHLMRISRRLIRAVKAAYEPDGYSVMQNGGAFNDVGHYHLHIFPRNKSDGFGWKGSDKKYEVSAEVVRKMKEHIL